MKTTKLLCALLAAGLLLMGSAHSTIAHQIVLVLLLSIVAKAAAPGIGAESVTVRGQ